MFKKLLLCFLIIGFANTAYAESQSDWKTRTGVRFGYSYINKGDQTEKLKSPHMFLLGFEMQQALKGGSWLDVLFIENISVAGLDQSVFAPSASLLIGFELADQVQLAIGGNVAPFDPAEEENYIHLITAIGYTAEVGLFSVPVHLTYIPDTNSYWRCAATVGVNW